MSRQPAHHLQSEAHAPVPEGPTQELPSLVSGQQAGLERAEKPESIRNGQVSHEVEGAVETEFIAARWRALVREEQRNVLRSKSEALLLKLIAPAPANEHIFSFRTIEWQALAGLQQPPRAKGEATVADVVPVMKVRPRGSNVVEVEKGWVPGSTA